VPYNAFADNTSIFICLAAVAFQICEIPWNSPKIRTYSSSRSSKVIDLDANGKCIIIQHSIPETLTVTLDVSPSVFEILTNLVRKQLVLSTPPLFDAPCGGTPCDINAYTAKSTFNGLQYRRWQYGSIFICLAVVTCQIREISRNFLQIRTYAVQGHPRSSILVSVESACNFLLFVHSNFQLDISPTVFEMTHLYSLFSHPILVWRRLALQYPHSLGIYIAEKHIYCVTILSQTLRVYSASSFVKPLLPSKIVKSREIPTKFDIKVIQGHHRSWCQSKAHVRLPISR